MLLANALKSFLENPELAVGAPLLAIGILGVLLVLVPVELRRPARAAAPAADAARQSTVEGHPTAEQYVGVGILLAIVTALEVALYYVDVARGALLVLLLTLSALKFVVVALWFMHLRFDGRLFSLLFSGGLALAAVLFAIVLITLGASLA